MKIKITTDRQPWVNGVPHDRDAEVDVSDADAEILIAAGFAVALADDTNGAPASTRRRRAAAEDGAL